MIKYFIERSKNYCFSQPRFLAQIEECQTSKPDVEGSNPAVDNFLFFYLTLKNEVLTFLYSSLYSFSTQLRKIMLSRWYCSRDTLSGYKSIPSSSAWWTPIAWRGIWRPTVMSKVLISEAPKKFFEPPCPFYLVFVYYCPRILKKNTKMFCKVVVFYSVNVIFLQL